MRPQLWCRQRHITCTNVNCSGTLRYRTLYDDIIVKEDKAAVKVGKELRQKIPRIVELLQWEIRHGKVSPSRLAQAERQSSLPLLRPLAFEAVAWPLVTRVRYSAILRTGAARFCRWPRMRILPASLSLSNTAN